MQYRCLILALLVLFGSNLDRARGQTTRKQAQPPPNIKNTTNSISSATSTAPSAELNVEAKGLVEAGMKYVEGGQYSQAIESFQHAVKLQPGYADAYSALGRTYFKTRQWQKSIDTLRHAALLHAQEARLQKLKTEKREQVITPVQSIPSPERKPASPTNTNVPGTKTAASVSGATSQLQQQAQPTTAGNSAAAPPDTAPHNATLGNSTSGNSSNAQSKPTGNTPLGNATPATLSAGNAQIKPAGNTTIGNSPSGKPSAGNAESKLASNTSTSNTTPSNLTAANGLSKPAGNTTAGNSSAGNSQSKAQQATNALPNPSQISQLASQPKDTGTPIHAPVPSAQPKPVDSALVAVTTIVAQAEVVVPVSKGSEEDRPELKREAVGEQVSAAASSPEAKGANPIAIRVSSHDAALTKIYRIGPNDILDVRINELQSPQSTLFTVTSSGLLEHPSLTEPLLVSGFTADEIGTKIETELSARALLENPAVTVGVRDYASHTILVSGLVKDPGTRFLRREAIPLYVVVADAQPLPEAARVTVVRNDLSHMYEIDLTRPEEMNLLVRPGDVITLHPNATQFLYIGGEVKSPGEKTFRRGLTLMQAIISAGGAAPKAKVAEVSRDDGRGFLAVSSLNLKDIQSGKVVDPLLRPGDRIMIFR